MTHTHIDTIVDVLEKDTKVIVLEQCLPADDTKIILTEIEKAFNIMREHLKDKIVHNENYEKWDTEQNTEKTEEAQ